MSSREDYLASKVLSHRLSTRKKKHILDCCQADWLVYRHAWSYYAKRYLRWSKEHPDASYPWDRVADVYDNVLGLSRALEGVQAQTPCPVNGHTLCPAPVQNLLTDGEIKRQAIDAWKNVKQYPPDYIAELPPEEAFSYIDDALLKLDEARKNAPPHSHYIPHGEFELTPFTSTAEVSKLNYVLTWKGRAGIMNIPVMLSPNIKDALDEGRIDVREVILSWARVSPGKLEKVEASNKFIRRKLGCVVDDKFELEIHLQFKQTKTLNNESTENAQCKTNKQILASSSTTPDVVSSRAGTVGPDGVVTWATTGLDTEASGKAKCKLAVRRSRLITREYERLIDPSDRWVLDRPLRAGGEQFDLRPVVRKHVAMFMSGKDETGHKLRGCVKHAVAAIAGEESTVDFGSVPEQLEAVVHAALASTRRLG